MKRTKQVQKSIRRRILILCEGKTEKNYFQAIKEDPTYSQKLLAVHPRVVVAKNPSPDQIVREAIAWARQARQEGNPYDKIWVVFDHDHQPKRLDAYEHALRQGFNVGFSAIAFETWYLIHFERSARAYKNAEALLDALDKHYPGYQKARQNDFTYLKQNLPQALRNAAWLRDQMMPFERPTTDRNPWTDIDQLVLDLIES